jgi:hypothetical protein
VDSLASTTETLDANAHATYSADRISNGTHIVTCVYSGDANYAPSSCAPITVENSGPVSVRK